MRASSCTCQIKLLTDYSESNRWNLEERDDITDDKYMVSPFAVSDLVGTLLITR